MAPVRRAVIDVGTNSVKLLVADIAGREIQPVFEGSRQTRLGRGFYESHLLQPGPITQTAQAVTHFVNQAHAQQATSIRIFATSAAREAHNRAELAAAVQEACGLPMQIISGEQEALWGFQGVTTDPLLATTPLLLVDIGGGSAQCIVGHGQQVAFQRSYPLGTVRLLERFHPSDPPGPEQLADMRRWLKDFLQANIAPELSPILMGKKSLGSRPVQLVGTGGTASILGCLEAKLTTFDRAKLEATRISRPSLRGTVEYLWSLSLEQRKQIPGLPPNRADVILAGAAIYEALLEQFEFAELRISTRGLRFAALLADGP